MMTIQELADRAEVTTRTIRYYVEQGVLPPPERGRPAEYTEEHVARLALIKRLKEQYLPLEEIRDTMQRLSLEEVEALAAQHSPQEAQTQKLDSAAEYITNVLGRGMVREQMKASTEYRVPSAQYPGPGTQVESEASVTPVEQEPTAPYSAPVPPTGGSAPVPPPAPPTLTPVSAPATAPTIEPVQPQAAGPGSLASRLWSSVVGRRSSDHEAATAKEESAYIPAATSWQRVKLGEGIELHFVESDDAQFNEKVTRVIESAHRILDEGPGHGE
jgi:DNA-binding transcriptional MerR regulator